MKNLQEKRNCLQCGKERLVKQSVLRKGYGKFCSVSCKSLWSWNKPGYREWMSKVHIGYIPTNLEWLKENAKTLEHRKLVSKARLGKSAWNKGTKMPQISGQNHYLWKGNPKMENKRIRGSMEYRQWREAVFKRDNWTCQECEKRGGKLQADHIKPFAFFKELRFIINNGRTLCVKCHRNTSTWGARVFKSNLITQ